MKSTRSPPAARTSGPWKRAAAPRPPIRSRQWRYRYIEGVGTNVVIEFVDTTMSGEYHMTMDPSEKDALLYVPGAGLTLYGADGPHQQDGPLQPHRWHAPRDGQSCRSPASMDEFARLEQFAKLQTAARIKFKDLEAAVSTHITFNMLPFKVQTDYIKVTDNSVLTNITMQFENRDLQFQIEERRAEGGGEYLRAHHHHVAPRRERFRGHRDRRYRRPNDAGANHQIVVYQKSFRSRPACTA